MKLQHRNEPKSKHYRNILNIVIIIAYIDFLGCTVDLMQKHLILIFHKVNTFAFIYSSLSNDCSSVGGFDHEFRTHQIHFKWLRSNTWETWLKVIRERHNFWNKMRTYFLLSTKQYFHVSIKKYLNCVNIWVFFLALDFKCTWQIYNLPLLVSIW